MSEASSEPVAETLSQRSVIIERNPAILGGRPVFRGTYPTIDRDDVLSVLQLARERLLNDAA